MRQALEVIAGRELRYHAAELLVQVDLRVDDVGEDAAAVFHDGDGRFVAAGFDAERQGQAASPHPALRATFPRERGSDLSISSRPSGSGLFGVLLRPLLCGP